MLPKFRHIGLLFFLGGLALWFWLPFSGPYTYDSAHLQHLGISPEQQKELSRELITLEEEYEFSFQFATAFSDKLNTYNSAKKQAEEWDLVIWSEDPVWKATKLAYRGPGSHNPLLFFILMVLVPALGGLLYALPVFFEGTPGIKNNGTFQSKLKNRGWPGILTGTFLIGFYILLYWFPEYISPIIRIFDPLSHTLSGNPASQWFLYGTLYTLAVAVMGVRMFARYRHSNYHLVRTSSLIFFQTCFAFLLPEILIRLNKPYFDFKNIWPLDYDFFDAWHLDMLQSSGGLGIFMLAWGLTLSAIGVPLFTYIFGKRWYCSWVCGCGGLAETLGDPYRHLSDKSLKAWQIERWMVHAVLVFSVLMTVGVLYTYITGTPRLLFFATEDVRQTYGFLIGSVFAGVVGTGFYPFMGNRVWCRFGCPLAAYLGLVQRFKSRFRITTNGGQCISCGNCSTYCEMGIDVRWYAQRGQNIVRSSCVGCGVCASVCPRGVLKLENGPEAGRMGNPIELGPHGLKLKTHEA
jgi:Pyruvate/2-oxoacid:ferredoxin oxidoreductase delta subunit